MGKGSTMQSEHIRITNLQSQFDRVEDVLADYLFRVGLTGKNETRFTLLTEEALRLAKSISNDDNSIELWLEGNARVSHICLMLKTQIDANKQEEFLSVSSSGENSADKTFFEELRAYFIKPKKPTWSLAEYEAELMRKRAEDKYSEEAWGNLERSVLANLADDIAVGVKDNHVLMIITKDFTNSIVQISSKKPVKISSQIFLSSDEESLATAYSKVDSIVAELSLKGKDSLRMKLLLEETIGMVEEMVGDFTAMIWVEKYASQCAVKFVGTTKMDADKKYEMLSLSSSGQNALVHGFMGKLKDIIETGMLNYESVMKLNQEYNGITVNYAGIGAYHDVSVATNPTAMSGFMWSMIDYRQALGEERKENEAMQAAWDELEKSIVASIADDVIVGIKSNKVQMTMIYKMKED